MEKCEDCEDEAGYICICKEEHLCEECIIEHITGDKTLKHRTVSLSHPLLCFLLESNEQNDENIEEELLNTNSQIQALEDFRNKCITLIDSKIQHLQKQELLEIPSDTNTRHIQNMTPIKNMNATMIQNISQLSYRSSKDFKHIKLRKFEDSFYSPGSIYRSHISHPESEMFFYKILVCGSEKSGKTCLITSFKNSHEENFENFVFKNIKLENLKISLEIVESKSGDFMSNALGALVVFDLTSAASLAQAEQIIINIEKNNPVLGVIILVGTRLDLVVSNPRKRISSFGSIQKIAINKGVLYDEISGINHNHVEELFMRLIRELYKKSNSVG